MVNSELLNVLFKKNDKTYNILKAAEELQELSLALIQSVSKNVENDKDVIEEIGDVDIRLGVVRKYFDEKKIQDRIDHKSNRIVKNLKSNKYVNRV